MRARLRATAAISRLLAEVCEDTDPHEAAEARERQREAEEALAAIPDT